MSSYAKQECIPVGCVPAARRPYSGVYFPEGGSAWSGGVLPGPGGSAWSGGGLPGLGGFSLVRGGGVLPGPGGGDLPGPGEGSSWSGGSPCPEGGSPCLETPPVDRITDTCKNITLATTSLRLVNKLIPCDAC